MNPKPTVLLSEAEAHEIALRVEGLVEEKLREKAERTTKYLCLMTDMGPGMRAVIDALLRNYT